MGARIVVKHKQHKHFAIKSDDNNHGIWCDRVQKCVKVISVERYGRIVQCTCIPIESHNFTETVQVL